jgi:hypothetical protein
MRSARGPPRSSATGPSRQSARRTPAPPSFAPRRARSSRTGACPREGESEYRFTADGAIRTLLIDESLRRQLSSGALVIARLDEGYTLLPRAAAEKVRERDAGMIVLDHGQAAGSAPTCRQRRG